MARIAARVVKRPPLAPYNGFGKRQPSTEPPVLTPAERDKLKVQAEADGAEARVGGSAASSSPNSNSDGSH
jgi:cell division protease FtsH